MKERLMKIILAPCVSEKTESGSASRQRYVFKVMLDATKVEIKKAVELLFGAKVAKIGIVNKKAQAIGAARRRPGVRKAFKKAYVTLEEGHQIDLAKIAGE